MGARVTFIGDLHLFVHESPTEIADRIREAHGEPICLTSATAVGDLHVNPHNITYWSEYSTGAD